MGVDEQPAPDITAANSSQMTDGASAMIIASADFAEQHGLPVRARFRHFAVAAEDPVLVLSAPVPVTYKLMNVRDEPEDWDAVECNEAFAAIALMWQKEFGYPMERFNPRGGAIALGHPLGASGVALMTRLSATSSTPAAVTASRRCAKAAAKPTPPSSNASENLQRWT